MAKKRSFRLPFGWCNWKDIESRPDFIRWAVKPRGCTSRYYVINDHGHIRWVIVSPAGQLVRFSSGAFYDDMRGGAIAAAVRGAKKHASKKA